MNAGHRFAETVERVSQLHPRFRLALKSAGDGWVEVDLWSRMNVDDPDKIRSLVRDLVGAARRENVSLVLDTDDFGDFDLAPFGFEKWIDTKLVHRKDPAWISSLEKVAGFSFDAMRNLSAVVAVDREGAFEELVDELLDASEWPDRGAAADRMRVAIFRSGELGIDGVREDLGMAAQRAYAGL